MTPPIRIIIVDDHPMVAEGIEALLEGFDDICVVDVLSDGEQAIAKATELQPDVILMDLNMPKVNGLSATEIILENAPNTKILILSMHDNPEYISTALNHGAMGYILKDVPTEEIKSAIDAVLTGQRYLCSGAKGGSSCPYDRGRGRAGKAESPFFQLLNFRNALKRGKAG